MSEDSKTAAQFLIECLENEGVQYAFGIPGEENLEILHALKKSKIRFITTRHEQGAAFMADVYGRLTHKAGVCLATLGPGATNLVTGVADANGDGAPLVAITGQVDTERIHLTSHQNVDLSKMFEPITKRTKVVVKPDTVNEIVRLAFKYAESERPGATYIDFPVDISKNKVAIDSKPLKREVPDKETAPVEKLEAAAAAIFKAKRPVILAGSQAIRSECSDSLTKFAESLKIPVINTMMAKGIIPCDNKYSMMTIGIPQKDYVNQLIEEADTVIAVGYDLVEFSPAKWNKQNNHTIIHISNRPAHINKSYQCTVQVVGDISDSLRRVNMRVNREQEPTWAFKIKEEFWKLQEKYITDNSFPLKPQRILFDIRKVMGDDDILISDVGAHKMWIGRLYECYQPNTCIISNGFASMGISVPGAFAAKLIYPDKKILAVTGDGGFMMNSQELETAVRNHINFVTIIFNDKNYGLIKWKEEDQYGEDFFVDFTNPDFVKLAEAMHCIGYRITKTEDFLPTLEKAFTQDAPVIIDVPVDYDENSKLSAELKAFAQHLQNQQ